MSDSSSLSVFISLLRPQIYGWLMRKGYIIDTTGSRQNVIDAARDNKKFTTFFSELSSAATKADTDSLVDGVLKVLGVDPKNVTSADKTEFYKKFWHFLTPFVYHFFGEETYDSLFGKFGSRAVTVRAILNAYSGFGLDGETAANLANKLIDEVHKDPSIAKGFTAIELSKILDSAVKNGLIAPTVNPDVFVSQFKHLMRYYAAARDILAKQGKSIEPETLTKFILETRSKYEGVPLDEAAFRLRRDAYILSMSPYGLYTAALAASGVQLPVSAQTVGMLDKKLRQNLRYSPAANIAGATIRAVKEMGARGPLLDLYTRIMNNEMPRVLPTQWIAMASRSGLSPGVAMALLRQNSRNISFITPEVEQSIRKAQFTYDIAPYIDRIMVAYRDPELRKGAIAQFAERLGYPNIGMMDAGQVMFLLHSSEVNDKASDILNYASTIARAQEDVSGRISGSTLRRVTEGLSRPPTDESGNIAWHKLIPDILGAVHRTELAPQLSSIALSRLKSDILPSQPALDFDFDHKLSEEPKNKEVGDLWAP